MFPDRKNGPASGAFVPAVFRGVTTNPRLGVDLVGLSLDTEGGSVCRLLISVETAKTISAALAESVSQFDVLTNTQSEKSSGNSSVDVSMQRE